MEGGKRSRTVPNHSTTDLQRLITFSAKCLNKVIITTKSRKFFLPQQTDKLSVVVGCRTSTVVNLLAMRQNGKGLEADWGCEWEELEIASQASS